MMCWLWLTVTPHDGAASDDGVGVHCQAVIDVPFGSSASTFPRWACSARFVRSAARIHYGDGHGGVHLPNAESAQDIQRQGLPRRGHVEFRPGRQGRRRLERCVHVQPSVRYIDAHVASVPLKPGIELRAKIAAQSPRPQSGIRPPSPQFLRPAPTSERVSKATALQ
jgi:hypothetical protein